MLKNFHVLDLSCVEGLWSPRDLIQLKELDLSYKSISSFPTSIGKLKNLTRLNLSNMDQLDCLPDEIHGLHKLEFLDISCSSISLLPNFLTKLKNLRVFDLRRTSIVDSAVPNQFMWDLVRQCPLLGCFGLTDDEHEDEPEYIKLEYELSFNRARSRVLLRDGTTNLPTPLWPSILSSAEFAFNRYQLCDDFCHCGRDEYDVH
jgi:hypothetical protein